MRNFANLIENRFTGHWWGDDWEALWVNFWSQIAIGALMTWFDNIADANDLPSFLGDIETALL